MVNDNDVYDHDYDYVIMIIFHDCEYEDGY